MPVLVKGTRRMKVREFDRWWVRYWWTAISPGGAAAVAGCGRITMYAWIARGLVRAWEFRRGEVYVHFGDVLDQAVRLGYRTDDRVAEMRARLKELEKA